MFEYSYAREFWKDTASSMAAETARFTRILNEFQDNKSNDRNYQLWLLQLCKSGGEELLQKIEEKISFHRKEGMKNLKILSVWFLVLMTLAQSYSFISLLFYIILLLPSWCPAMYDGYCVSKLEKQQLIVTKFTWHMTRAVKILEDNKTISSYNKG